MPVVSSVELSNLPHAYSEAEATDGLHHAGDVLKLAATANVNDAPGIPIPDLGRAIEAECEAGFHHRCIRAADPVPPTDRRIS
jgi:hypothetical protein